MTDRLYREPNAPRRARRSGFMILAVASALAAMPRAEGRQVDSEPPPKAQGPDQGSAPTPQPAPPAIPRSGVVTPPDVDPSMDKPVPNVDPGIDKPPAGMPRPEPSTSPKPPPDVQPR